MEDPDEKIYKTTTLTSLHKIPKVWQVFIESLIQVKKLRDY